MSVHRRTTPLLALLVSACATHAPQLEPDQAAAPVNATDEGLWLVSRLAERQLQRSGLPVETESLADYVSRVNCRVAGPRCNDIRVYTVRIPDFNASMAPNGFMQVRTGLLLRLENEAQLATVLGHETSHFTLRHTLERFRASQQAAGVLLAAQIGMLVSGAGGAVDVGPIRFDVGDLGALVAGGVLAAYSREQENGADREGLKLMADAGYAAGEAAEVWGHLMAEKQQCDLPEPPALFASHPPSKERLEVLRALAEQRGTQGEAGRRAYLDATLPYRSEWLRAELAQHQFCRTRVVLERLLEDDPRPGELYYFLGETYRLRGEDGDLQKAIAAYGNAVGKAGAPVQLQRERGLALRRAGRPQDARDAFRRYLADAGEPDDEAMIRAYLEAM